MIAIVAVLLAGILSTAACADRVATAGRAGPTAATHARLVAFPYPPELFVHVIGEEDRRRVILSGIACPDPDRAVRPLWNWIASPVRVEWEPDGLHGDVYLVRKRTETNAAGLLIRAGGCAPDSSGLGGPLK